ncbi:MAG: hypothetical protein Q4F41_00285 [Eubacteriales bacterium]|nr:hypothetical protein [Eubacteriales bacterium]
MRAAKKAVRYWSIVLGEVILLGLAGSVCMAVISLLGAREFQIGSAVRSAAVAWVILSVMVMLVYMLGWYEAYLPVLLASGCRRKEAFLGMEMAKVVISACIGLIGTALMAFLGEISKNAGEIVLLWLLLSLLVCAVDSVGEMVGALYCKIGKIAIAGVGILFGILGALLGVTVASGVKQHMGDVFEAVLKLQERIGIILAASLALSAVSMFITWLTMRKIEVRM